MTYLDEITQAASLTWNYAVCSLIIFVPGFYFRTVNPTIGLLEGSPTMVTKLQGCVYEANMKLWLHDLPGSTIDFYVI